jgi:DNA-binding transcriptional regulator YiaG
MQAEKGDRMTIKNLRALTKMTQKQFAEYLNIPFRTIQDWEYEKRIPPSYVVELIEFRLRAEGII